jgi:hypothetical protein
MSVTVFLGRVTKMIDQMSLAAAYAILVGIFVVLQWVYFLATKQVSELETEPAKIIFHLVAEFITAAALLIGGWGLLKDRAWGLQVHLISMGMLLYTLIDSPGHYVHIREWSMVGVFVVFLIFAFVTLRPVF